DLDSPQEEHDHWRADRAGASLSACASSSDGEAGRASSGARRYILLATGSRVRADESLDAHRDMLAAPAGPPFGPPASIETMTTNGTVITRPWRWNCPHAL